MLSSLSSRRLPRPGCSQFLFPNPLFEIIDKQPGALLSPGCLNQSFLIPVFFVTFPQRPIKNRVRYFLSEGPGLALFSGSHQLSPADRPKVVRKVPVSEVLIGHGKIPFFPPILSPGIPDDKYFLRMVISDGHHGMSA